MNDVTPSKIAQNYVLERIAIALEDIANHFTQAAAPSDEYERGRADERAAVLAHLENERLNNDGALCSLWGIQSDIKNGEHVGKAAGQVALPEHEPQPQRTPGWLKRESDRAQQRSSSIPVQALPTVVKASSSHQRGPRYVDDPAEMLRRAAGFAAEYDDRRANRTLMAAVYIALRHPEWFGGEACQ